MIQLLAELNLADVEREFGGVVEGVSEGGHVACVGIDNPGWGDVRVELGGMCGVWR